MIFTKAQDVISYLYSLPKFHAKGDLSFIRRVLEELDNPQDKVKMLHVTGTNGKGSTSYYLSNLLQKAGQKTGLFVSPYVFAFGERIQLNGQNISDPDLVATANQIEQVLQKIRQTDPDFGLVTFEYEAVMAFTYFAKTKCDYAVIEVGIGGTHDSTNVINPEVSVITTIGLDHEKIIGPTIQDIAREKSGIIKYQRPIVLGNVPQSVLPIIKEKAEQEQVPVYQLGQDFMVKSALQTSYRDASRTLTFAIRPEVEGYDLAVAIRAFSTLNLPLSDEKIEEAINHTVIPGRYQILQEQPLIILDGAHNIQAMQNLLNFVHEQQARRRGKVRVLITMMKDKDLAEVFSLFQASDQVELTTIAYPRAAKKADFPSAVQAKYPYYASWQTAFTQLKQDSQPNDILLVTGSFYLVGEVLQLEATNASSRH
ncbi:bifunctional folylpolyglutamate synthase/dihydrofolate synthase [Lactobacillus sp. ESL0679]|uniref:bifunctional folylpolyglutamate synthase/dihydrofolate synthase n=1 Tax=Lactobacillus sp. ESL0679 TaxID=2983209 RepID=UPI0023F62F41|nr:bifunctional folylpolyglutamate synthase/dihydrofolate synthase [Lactobacillus sp. ESL0679]